MFSNYLSMLREWAPELSSAVAITVELAVLSYIGATAIGLLIAFARRSSNSYLRRFSVCYVELVRGTPLLTQLFLLYFGLAAVGLQMSAMTCAVLSLAINYGAYMSETYRAGFMAIDGGQREAALAIGMTSRQAMISIILPQSLKVVFKPMINYAISITRDTSLASFISAPEIMLRTNDLSSQYFTPMRLYLTAGAIYFVLSFIINHGLGRAGRRALALDERV